MVEYEYDLELDKLVLQIKEKNAKSILLHLPDGLKPKAEMIQEFIYKHHPDIDVIIWAGSNFGSCDLPVDAERSGVDLIVHFGHSPWLS